MKKEYVTPKVEVMELEASSIICMSGGDAGNGRPAQSPSESFFFDDETDNDY